jgi:RHS repeat-associated protein
MIQKGAPEGDLTTDRDYDENGNETLLKDPKGQTVTSTYDELNRLKTKTYAFAPGPSTPPWRHTTGMVYGYDENNNLRTVDETVASGTDPPTTEVLTTTRDYDDLDRLKSETTPLPDAPSTGPRARTVNYTYFQNGTRKTVTDPANLITSYSYDAQNRLETATTAAGTTTYKYWPDDLLRDVTYPEPNNVKASYSYDKADRLLSVVNSGPAGLVSSFEYQGTDPATGQPVSYDPNGNRLIQVEKNGGLTETTTYSYDDLNRLKTVTYPADASFPQGRKVTYGYDSVGNRTSETTTNAATGSPIESKTASFDALNRLARVTHSDPSQTVAFDYDKNGNQTKKTVGPDTPSPIVTEYRYDVRDKLVEVAQPGGSTPARFQYDFEGRRSLKVGEGLAGDNVRQYVYDQTSLLLEYDAAGSQVAKYEYGSDRLISLFRRDEPRRYFSFDGLRSVTNLTADDGSTVASYHLDAWGQYRRPEELEASKNRWGFTGYYFDPETSLLFAKARYFDPNLGRFLSQDSFLGNPDEPPSLHRYFYAYANPTRFVDPTGHQSADLANEYQIDREVKKAEQEQSWCAANPAACQAKKATEAKAQQAADTSVAGGLRAGGGGVQIALAIALASAPEPATKVLAILLAFRGGENLGAGGKQLVTGRAQKTATGVIIEEGLRAGDVAEAEIQPRAAATEAIIDVSLGLAALPAAPGTTTGLAAEPFESGLASPGRIVPGSVAPVAAAGAPAVNVTNKGLPRGEVWLDTAELRFSQKTAGGGGRTEALRESLAQSGWDPSKGSVDVIRTERGLVTFDNTRVALAREMGIEKVSGRVRDLAEPLPQNFVQARELDVQARRLGLPEPKTWGDALRVRTMGNRLPLEGTETPPRLR